MKRLIKHKINLSRLVVGGMTFCLFFPLNGLAPSSVLAQESPGLQSPSESTPSSSPSTPASTGDNQSDLTLPNLSDLTVPTPDDFVNDFRDQTQTVDLTALIEAAEGYQSNQYADFFGFKLYGELTPVEQISEELCELGKVTNTKPALIYSLSAKDALTLVLVLPDRDCVQQAQADTEPKVAAAYPEQIFIGQGSESSETDTENNLQIIRKFVPEAKRKQLMKTVDVFRNEVSDPSQTRTTNYLNDSQQLYEWMITPLKTDIDNNGIDTLIFSMDTGLRSLPIAALHDGQQFLVEQYNLALIPSFSLTDTRYKSLQSAQMLGMGISEATEDQTPLPSVAVEIPVITEQIWQGEGFLNEEVTEAQLKALTAQQQFGIIHLATHGEFEKGNPQNSFIQLWDDKLNLEELRSVALQSRWNAAPIIEMLVLSACETALGSTEAELGFSGLAIQTGVKTALGSLWKVSDEGTLGLMTEFYSQLKTAPTKSAALRQAQLAMLNGQVQISGDQLQLSNSTQIPLPPGLLRDRDLSHPFFWSPFTVVGNWN